MLRTQLADFLAALCLGRVWHARGVARSSAADFAIAGTSTGGDRLLGYAENIEGPPGCPKRSFNCLQQFHINGRLLDSALGGPISQPYPTREPLLIGAPRAAHRTDVMAKPSLQAIATIHDCDWYEREGGTSVPVIRLFHSDGICHVAGFRLDRRTRRGRVNLVLRRS